MSSQFTQFSWLIMASTCGGVIKQPSSLLQCMALTLFLPKLAAIPAVVGGEAVCAHVLVAS